MSGQEGCICGNNPTIDGYRLRSQACTAHPAPVVEPDAPREYTREEIDFACDWSDWRSAHGVSPDDAVRRAEHRAFKAGWEAARGAIHNGVLR